MAIWEMLLGNAVALAVGIAQEERNLLSKLSQDVNQLSQCAGNALK
ncbi:hypothetical protein [Vibrio parahaemolyticus]|nr:hypothetical protein [Vibrio parahaemolyticus]EJG1038504.1 hypothetical protein [Vibrio parahaemolyticus]EJG1057940.1 hypothetical protein [Vibrio parahaemolyticus]EJG1091902.1 hypothetical protein [Vibrio parahaemolyticus]EJY0700945.1 hypothetical protein [Vibrio parahaemolyticus]ELA6986456.1 hypothetical protein [Vibrio parahaemolyticus]